MKIYYIANVRLPTEKAHGIQIMEMCQAFANSGIEVELVIPNRKTIVDGVEKREDPFEFYGVKPNFKIKRLWCFDWVKWGKLGFIMQSLTFAESAAWYALTRRGPFYTREELLAAVLGAMGKEVVWEAHMGQRNFLVRFLIRSRVPLVVITQGLKDLYIRLGMPEEMIHVAPDGVSFDKFRINETRSEARRRIGFGKNAKVALYTGHLYSWKGADTLATAASFLSPDVEVVFVGGTDKHIADFKERYGKVRNIRILGKKPHSEMPMYLKAADLLILPNSSKEDISRLYTSPMKLFEYMASGTPIISSDLPSLREVLTDEEAHFFTPDDPKSLADTIMRAFQNMDESKNKAQSSLEKVREYSWEKRAEKILEFIS